MGDIACEQQEISNEFQEPIKKHNSSTRRKKRLSPLRLSKRQTQTTYDSTLKCKKMRMKVHLKFNQYVDRIPSDVRQQLSQCKLMDVKDFGPEIYRQCYQQTTVPFCRVVPSDPLSRDSLCFFAGLLARNQEVGLIPLNEDLVLMLYEDNMAVSGMIVARLNVVFDLDDTLVQTRMASGPLETLSQNEYAFFLLNHRMITRVRRGTQKLLKWASTLFKVFIFTNGMFEYARQILKVLDPDQEHILRGINTEEQLRSKLISRESLSTYGQQKGWNIAFNMCQFKDLRIVNLSLDETVILDDTSKVWLPAQRRNLLPFDECCQRDFFECTREEIWKLFNDLNHSKYQKVRHNPILWQDEIVCHSLPEGSTSLNSNSSANDFNSTDFLNYDDDDEEPNPSL